MPYSFFYNHITKWHMEQAAKASSNKKIDEVLSIHGNNEKMMRQKIGCFNLLIYLKMNERSYVSSVQLDFSLRLTSPSYRNENDHHLPWFVMQNPRKANPYGSHIFHDFSSFPGNMIQCYLRYVLIWVHTNISKEMSNCQFDNWTEYPWKCQIVNLY